MVLVSFFIRLSAQAQAATPQQPSTLEMLTPFIFIFIVFYFLIFRPQSKKQKEHQKFLGELKRGDEVITASGILGTIEGINDQFVTLEVASGVRIKMLRNQVAASQKTMTQPQEGKK